MSACEGGVSTLPNCSKSLPAAGVDPALPCLCTQSFGALPSFPSGALADLFGAGAQPSSSGSSGGAGHTLAHELLGLPSMSQGFNAKVRGRALGAWEVKYEVLCQGVCCCNDCCNLGLCQVGDFEQTPANNAQVIGKLP